MLVSTITTKGQVTLPVKLRKKLGVKPADRIIFVQKNGDILIQKITPLNTLFGSLANPKVVPLTTEQMNSLIEKKMFKKNDLA